MLRCSLRGGSIAGFYVAVQMICRF